MPNHEVSPGGSRAGNPATTPPAVVEVVLVYLEAHGMLSRVLRGQRMIAVVQRVASASVSVEGREISRIGVGLVILLAVGKSDTEEEARWVAEKCAGLRIFEDEQGKMNKSMLETKCSALVVSQFTLYGDCSRGRRPSFVSAAPPARARELFDAFCGFMEDAGAQVKTGVFGEKMSVCLENDGPVTLIVQKEASG